MGQVIDFDGGIDPGEGLESQNGPVFAAGFDHLLSRAYSVPGGDRGSRFF